MPSSTLEIKPIFTEQRKSQYEPLMRKFREARKEICMYTKPENLNIPEVDRNEKRFCTNSTYEGAWNILGMNGFGTYNTYTGAVYEGRLEDGEFHGKGEMTFPSGDSLRGKWEKGLFKNGEYFFNDTLQFESENWTYCRMPDRRFFIEVIGSIQPVNQSYKTAEQPTKEIPDGFYDTGDGFYDPVTRVIYKYDNLTEIMRTVSDEEQEWIVQHCRQAPDKVIGPQPYLYEAYYQPTKYLDGDSSESDISCLTEYDDEFVTRFQAMKARDSSRLATLGEGRYPIRSKLDSEYYDPGSSIITHTESTVSNRHSGATHLDGKGRLSNYVKRPKLFI